MKRTIWIASLFLLVVGLAVGIQVATDTYTVDAGEPPLEQPEEQAPESAPEVLSICGFGVPTCNDSNCFGPNCTKTCDVGRDTGWEECCKNGHLMTCGAGNVFVSECECGGGICSSPTAATYWCP